MENSKNISLNLPDGSIQSDQVYYERKTKEAHEIAARLMAEHFVGKKKKEPAQE